jgi:hypothetical protein
MYFPDGPVALDEEFPAVLRLVVDELIGGHGAPDYVTDCPPVLVMQRTDGIRNVASNVY